jgi:hypothetical protein
VSYIDYAWARAQRGAGWGDTELDKQLAATTRGDPPFYGVIMLAMMRADSVNAAKLRDAWPYVWNELHARYDAPGAILRSDGEPLRRKVLAS